MYYKPGSFVRCQKLFIVNTYWFSHFFFESRSYVFPGGLWTFNDPRFTSQVLRITGVARPYLIKNSEGLLWDKGLVTEVQNQQKIRYSCYICECFVLVIAIKVKIKMVAISRWWCTLNIQRLRIWGVKIVTLGLFEASQRYRPDIRHLLIYYLSGTKVPICILGVMFWSPVLPPPPQLCYLSPKEFLLIH